MTDELDGLGWVLWAGTIGLDSPVASRVEAARAAGFTRVSMSAPDVARVAEQGTTPEQLGRQLRELGLEVAADPVMNWYGGAPFPPFSEMNSITFTSSGLNSKFWGSSGAFLRLLR